MRVFAATIAEVSAISVGGLVVGVVLVGVAVVSIFRAIGRRRDSERAAMLEAFAREHSPSTSNAGSPGGSGLVADGVDEGPIEFHAEDPIGIPGYYEFLSVVPEGRNRRAINVLIQDIAGSKLTACDLCCDSARGVPLRRSLMLLDTSLPFGFNQVLVRPRTATPSGSAPLDGMTALDANSMDTVSELGFLDRFDVCAALPERARDLLTPAVCAHLLRMPDRVSVELAQKSIALWLDHTRLWSPQEILAARDFALDLVRFLEVTAASALGVQ